MLFLELDGSLYEHRHQATLACIEALFDRIMNPPLLDSEMPTIDDVNSAEQTLIALIGEEAAKVREFIESRSREDE
jgi:DNA gyrase/topoisomerase IV subunit B